MRWQIQKDSVYTAPAFAASALPLENELVQIASSLIVTTNETTKEGAIQTTYSDLDTSVAYVQEHYSLLE